MSAPLTARGVKAMLSRSGVDHSALTIIDRMVTARRVDINYSGPWERRNKVVITGPEEARRKATWALFDRGLTCAPCGGRDEWSRP